MKCGRYGLRIVFEKWRDILLKVEINAAIMKNVPLYPLYIWENKKIYSFQFVNNKIAIQLISL